MDCFENCVDGGVAADSSEGWGGVRVAGPGRKIGRPRKSDEQKGGGKTVSAYLSQDDADYLATFGAGTSAALRELIDRARKFWPAGL